MPLRLVFQCGVESEEGEGGGWGTDAVWRVKWSGSE